MNRSDLLAAARTPTAEWLAECFGPDAVWRPAEAELPARLEAPAARAFLTTVGIPAVDLDFINYDSTGLPLKGMWEEDPDELFGNRYPDDDTPPASYSYCIGMRYPLHLMLRGDTGTVEVYNADGWDHASGYGGHAADSPAQVIGALALVARWKDRLTGDGAREARLELVSLLEELGQGPDDSSFWSNVVEQLEDEYDDGED